jgi:hypothetical protein
MKSSPSQLDVFMPLYYASDADLQAASLDAATSVLRGGVSAAWQYGGKDKYVTGRGLAERYGVHETTVWRWQFPYEDWAGLKRYDVAKCDEYLRSAELRLRKAELRLERAAQGHANERASSPFSGKPQSPRTNSNRRASSRRLAPGLRRRKKTAACSRPQGKKRKKT